VNDFYAEPSRSTTVTASTSEIVSSSVVSTIAQATVDEPIMDVNKSS